MTSIRTKIAAGNRCRGGVKSMADLIKPEYLGQYIDVDYQNRTNLVRAFMGIFKEKEFGQYDIKRITHFLKRKHLTKAEIHAIVFKLGYHYKRTVLTQAGNIRIHGYYDHKPS